MEKVKNEFCNKKNENKNNEKTATNNQWVSTGKNLSDKRERRDGPGGESLNK